MRRRIGVVMGGSSNERDVSLQSGRAIADALELSGQHQVVRIVAHDERDLLSGLREGSLDAVFLALHGRWGEDGCVQSILEMLRIPYTGSRVLSSALAMDKLKAKELFRLHNVPTPPYYTVSASEQAVLDELHGSFGFPVVVKPRREGSSVGVTKANDAAELAAAVQNALQFDDEVLIERFIASKEVAVGILDGRVLGAIEIAPEGDLYDYHAKYESDRTRYYMPARLEATRYQGVLNLAERAAAALDCRGAVRVDLLVTEGGNEYVLEVNTCPGMTEHSLMPKIARAAGYDLPALCEAILSGATPAKSNPTTPAVAAPSAAEPMRLAV